MKNIKVEIGRNGNARIYRDSGNKVDVFTAEEWKKECDKDKIKLPEIEEVEGAEEDTEESEDLNLPTNASEKSEVEGAEAEPIKKVEPKAKKLNTRASSARVKKN